MDKTELFMQIVSIKQTIKELEKTLRGLNELESMFFNFRKTTETHLNFRQCELDVFERLLGGSKNRRKRPKKKKK